MKRVLLSFKPRQNPLPIFVVLLVSLGIGLILVPNARYRINNDAVSYISIARKYAQADFRHAVNGYWGPMFSWLIVPAIWTNSEPTVYIRVLQVLLSVLLVWFVYLLVLHAVRTKWPPLLAAISTAALSLEWALYGPITPDLLSCLLAVILLYLFVKYRPSTASIKANILIGALGALGYYAKSVGFIFFVCVWLAWVIADYLFPRGASKEQSFKQAVLQTIRRAWISLTVFLVIALPFIGAISMKYQQLTISTSGVQNFRLYGPESNGWPYRDIVIAPHNDTAVSAGEDSSTIPLPHWSPLESRQNLYYFLRLVYRNILTTITLLFATIPMLATLSLLSLLERTNRERNRMKSILFVGAFTVTAVYWLTAVEARYIQLLFITLTVFAALFAHSFLRWNKTKFALVGMICIFATPTVLGIQRIRSDVGVRKELFTESNALASVIPEGTRLVSDDPLSLYVCHFTGCQYYGVIKPANPEKTKSR